MDQPFVSWDERLAPRSRMAVIGFSGWGDAGSASSEAARHLIQMEGSRRVARIEAEEFLDFQVERPTIRLTESGDRQIEWPDFEVFVVPIEDDELVVVTGPEPNIRWRRFVSTVAGLLRESGVDRAVTLGAFAGQVPHTLPVPLVGSSPQPEALDGLGLLPSGYEGPTGIVGVLNQALAAASIQVVSVWAAIPHYLASQPYPPATETLVTKTAEILGVLVSAVELEEASVAFRQRVEDALDDPDLRSYVKELEEESPLLGGDPGERLVEEIERFLRGG